MKLIFTLRATPALKRTAFALLFFTMSIVALAQTSGDYRSVGSGNWSTLSSWQRYNGSAWVAATSYPGQTTGTGTVSIQTTNSITVDVSVPNAIGTLAFTGTVNTFTINSPNSLIVTGAVTINNQPSASVAVTITGSGTLTAGSVTVGGTTAPSANSTLTTVLTSAITNFTINNNVTIVGIFSNGNRRNNATFAFNSGSMSVGGTITLNNNELNLTAAFTTPVSPQTGTLKVAGTNPFATSGVGTRTFTLNGTGSTVEYNRSGTNGDQTIFSSAYNNLITSGSGTKSLAATLSIAGNLTVSGTSILDLGTFTANTTGVSKTLQVDNGATLRIGGTNTLPSGYISSPTFGTTSTIEYYGTDQVVGAATYGNLLLTGSGTKSTTAAINVSGTMTVNNGVVFTPGAGNTIGGTGQLAGTGTIKVTRIAAVPDLITQYPIVLGNTSALASLTVDYAGAGAQTVNGYTYGNLIISGSGTKTAGASLGVQNNITVSSGILDLVDFAADNTTGAGNFTVSAGATLRIGGNHILPQNYSASGYLFNPTSTVEFYDGTHAILGRTFGNLVLTGTTTVTATASETVVGNFTIGSGATFNATDGGVYTHNIQGNLINDGTFNGGSGTGVDATTINFTGTNAQAISGGGQTVVKNLSINKSSNSLTLNANVTIGGGGLLTFGNGTINTLSSDGATSATGLLVFGDNASYTGLSDNSFVNGAVQKLGNDGFVFPVGKSGSGYHQIGISGAGGSIFTAEYIRKSASSVGTALEAGGELKAISNCEYWNLTRNSGSTDVQVTLFWNANSPCNGKTYIIVPAVLAVAHFKNGTWHSHGGDPTGNAQDGTVTSVGAVTDFNGTLDQFTIGSTDAAQAPLPVTFVSFNGKKVEGGTQLTWKVGGEVNVKEYQVERSIIGNSGFVKVGTVSATGSSSYSFTDAANNSAVFYRIKNVDNDGRFTYSTVLQFRNGNTITVFHVVPTLVTSNTVVQHDAATSQATVILSTADGKVVRSLRPAAGSMQTVVDMNNLHPGLYLLKWNDGRGSVEVAKVVKQ